MELPPEAERLHELQERTLIEEGKAGELALYRTAVETYLLLKSRKPEQKYEVSEAIDGEQRLRLTRIKSNIFPKDPAAEKPKKRKPVAA